MKTMKTLMLGLLLAGVVSVSGQTKSEPKKSEPKKSEAVALGLPATAEKLSDGIWKWKDSKGTVWIYRKGPFGFARAPEETGKAAEPAKAPPPAGLKVVEVKAGEVVFEQATPFGRAVRKRAIADLNAEEKAVYQEYEKAKAAQQSK